jgi:hypothetical protein
MASMTLSIQGRLTLSYAWKKSRLRRNPGTDGDGGIPQKRG